MSSYAPEPSPAPTLAGVPGYFPPTPDLTSSSSAHPDPFSSTSTATEDDTIQHRVNNAAGVLMGAAAGLVAGGISGAATLAGIVGLGELENDGLKSKLAQDEATTPTEEKKEPFDTQGEKSQSALEESPAQELVNSEGEDGSKLTGAGAMGGALLAGGAGAKLAENEVSEPVNEDHSLTPTATRDETETSRSVEPSAPDFGTPAIEKEQAALADSPAQRLLGSRSDSTIGAENVLLAGGAGAVVPERELEEPDLEAPKEIPGGAMMSPSESTSEPLERQISSVPNPAPETPRPGMNTQESSTSFTAAVLAASRGIDTPTREDVPLSMSGSTGVHPLVKASDQFSNDDPIKSTIPEEGSSPTSTSTPRTHPNILPVFNPAGFINRRGGDELPRAEEALQAERAEQAATGEVVHNPPPQTLIAPVTETPETVSQPEDFEPYTPPIVPQQEQDFTTQDKGKGREVEMIGAGVGAGAGTAFIAHELQDSRDSSERPSSQPGSVFREVFTPQPQAVEYNPLAIENQRAIPPQQAQGDPVLVLPVVDKGKGRAIDPEDLQNVPSTTAEQAGFAPGAERTVASEEFAHLSQPAPQAEIAAQREVPQTTAVPLQSEPKEKNVSNVAVPAIAGLAVGAAAPLAVNNNTTSAHLSQNPMAPLQQPPAAVRETVPVKQQTVQQTVPAVQQVPIARQAAPVVQQAQPIAQQAQPSRVYATQPTPVQTQSVAPVQPTLVANHSPTSPQGHGGLAEGVERSPHMKIQTHHDDSGHKKLHRKSLAADRKPLAGIGATKASKPDRSIENEGRRERMMDGISGVPDPTRQQPIIVQQPMPVQQQQGIPVQLQQQHQQGVPVQVQQRQPQSAVHYQQQPSPIARGPAGSNISAVPVQAGPHQVAGVTSTGIATPPPVGSGLHGQPQQRQPQQVMTTSNPSSPVSPTASSPAHNETVHRKLSKSRPRSKSNASNGNTSDREKSGFLNKVFGRHSRGGSGSNDGGSNRGSVELQRPAQ